MPNIVEQEAAIEFLHYDALGVIKGAESDFPQALPAGSLEYKILNTEPLAVVSINGLIQKKPPDKEPVMMRSQYNPELGLGSFIKIRAARNGGSVSSRDGEIRQAIREDASKWAELIYTQFQEHRDELGDGYVSFLNRQGITTESLRDVFSTVKAIADRKFKGKSHASDIMAVAEVGDDRVLPFSIPPIDVQGRKIIVKDMDPTTAQTAIIAVPNEREGVITLYAGILCAENASSDVLDHEQAHLWFAQQAMKRRRWFDAVSATGPGEQFSQIIEGADPREVVTFAAASEEALLFYGKIDEVLKDQSDGLLIRLENAIRQFYQEEQGLSSKYACGVLPIPGSGMALLGLGIIPYSLDKMKGAVCREEILAHPEQYSSPEDVLDLILK